MTKTKNSTSDLATGSRRLVGLERNYSCGGCGAEHRSWTRVRSCPDCGEHLSVAVIRRALVVPA